jgi:hypothetical protein
MDTEKRWKPNDVIRLAAVVGGFLLFVPGVWMLYNGIQAAGVIDLKSAMLSGTLKTASAGLFVCLFALFIIVFALAIVGGSNRQQTPGPKTRHERLIIAFWGLLVGAAVCGIGAALSPGYSVFSMGFIILAMTLVSVVSAIING